MLISRLILCLLISGNSIVGYSQSLFTGSFLADSRPDRMMYLVLTQTKNSVSGSLIIITPNSRGSTKSRALVLQGIADGDAITLTSTRFLDDSIVINGRKQRNTIMLMFPTDSGKILNIAFLPTAEDRYNQLLNQWQEELEVNYRLLQAESANAQKEKEKLTKLADDLSNAINSIKSSLIEQNFEDLKFALENEQFALENLENDLFDLKRNATVRPMTCYQANFVVSFDFNSRMAYSYNSKLGYASNTYSNRLKELEERLSNVESLSTEAREKAQRLALAIESSKYPLSKLRVLPGDEEEALVQYQKLADLARQELPFLKATHLDILDKAKEIMKEGELILKETQALIRCN